MIGACQQFDERDVNHHAAGKPERDGKHPGVGPTGEKRRSRPRRRGQSGQRGQEKRTRYRSIEQVHVIPPSGTSVLFFFHQFPVQRFLRRFEIFPVDDELHIDLPHTLV
ncbi:hypothetical protein SDC9_163653 [bioreactor metagenome]|uniref:Uncharacterized protein n=1 Tax=bioreactor metagenome TaxID=1076179 RepID=A0A645FWC3_9ZZZZ